MSRWPNPDPFHDPAWFGEHCDAQAWTLATDPAAAPPEPEDEWASPAMLARARELANGPVDRYRAICEFDAAREYLELSPAERAGIRRLAANRGQFRLLAWCAAQEALHGLRVTDPCHPCRLN